MVTVSAPAKVILFGEHAVVYGHPAIAVPVSSLRVTALAEFRPHDGEGVKMVSGDFAQTLPVDASAIDSALSLAVRLVFEALNCDPPDITITLHSDIPVASGLGSGAAVSAAIVRALSMVVNRPLGTEKINQLVYEVEKLHHGTPSGVDNTVIVYEQPVYFVRGQPIETITIAKPFHLLIADSGRSALTRVAVRDVRKLYEGSASQIQGILDSIGELAVKARAAITTGMTDALGPLMVENHALLQQLTVSSPELDMLVTAAMDAGALGAKLSGGGRGGNMIALVTEQTRKSVSEALRRAGAVRVVATIVGEH